MNNKLTLIVNQDELDALYIIAGKIGGNPDCTLRNNISNIYIKRARHLSEHVQKIQYSFYGHYCTGDITFRDQYETV